MGKRVKQEEIMNNPIISVVLSTYNDEKYIEESIQSILGQTFQNFEFIIINDGSCDNTESIIKQFKDERIIYIKNEKNLGLPTSLNIGLHIARGKYIARMDADDISLPKRFQVQLRFMERNQDIAVCGCFYKRIGQAHEVYRTETKAEMNKIKMIKGPTVPHPGFFIRKSFIDQYTLRYNTRYRATQDYEFLMHVIKYGEITNVGEILLLRREHKGQISHSKKSMQDRNADNVRVNMLRYAGINLSKNQRKRYLHNLLSNKLNLSEFINLSIMYVRIINGNKQYGFFEQSLLSSYLWKDLCDRKIAIKGCN